jgi:carboxymethylenebutenolidase
LENIKTQSLSYKSEGVEMEAYFARPDADGNFPAVVVIHEIYGLNLNIREVAERFARNGFVALAVDLFSGRSKAACVVRVMGDQFKAPEQQGGVHDLQAALTFLGQQPGVDPARLGAIGFCLGGAYALAFACSDNRLKAIAPYYGMNPRPLEKVQNACPVVASYPTGDFTTSAAPKLEAALETYKIPHDIKIYEGAQHSFFNNRSSRYNAAAAEDSWARVMSFFDKHL